MAVITHAKFHSNRLMLRSCKQGNIVAEAKMRPRRKKMFLENLGRRPLGVWFCKTY